MSEGVRYEDVPKNAVFEGHDGVAEMCTAAFLMSSDFTFEIVSRQTDGGLYAFESTGTGTNTGAVGPIPATGRSSCSAGSASAASRPTDWSRATATTGT